MACRLQMGNQESKIQGEETDVRKFSHFPHTDVKEWSNAFQTLYPDGSVTPKNLEEIMMMFFPFGDVRPFSERLFQTINIGQTGYIDFNELLIAFSILVKGSKYERLRWIFRLYDRDNDGVVSSEEMTEVVSSLHMMARGIVASGVDAKILVNDIFTELENQSGFLTFNDFERLSTARKEVFDKLSLFMI